MSENTIFQGNPTPQPPNVPSSPSISSPPPLGSRNSAKTIVKIGLLIFFIITVLFIILSLLPMWSPKTEEKNVTLSYWGLLEDESAMKPIISDFENENPNLKIEYTKQDPLDYVEKLDVRIPNGNGPDIFTFHNTWYLALSDFLLPLPRETIEKKEFSKSYYNVAETDLIKNGVVLGIPLGIDTLALFINPELFEEARVPTTWQEFVDTSQALTKRNEDGGIVIAGAAMGTFENVTHAPDIISLLFAQNGVDMQDFRNSETKIADALRFYTNFALVEDNVWDDTLPNSTTMFSSGKLAMYFGYSRDYFTIKANNPNLSFKIVSVPQLLKDEGVNIASYYAEGISSKSKHPKEALLFMKYLANPKVQQKLSQPFSNKKLADELKGNEFFVFVDQAKTAISSPFVDSTYDNGLNDGLNQYLGAGVNSVLRGGSEESAVKTLLEGYSQVFAEYEGKL